MIAFRLSGGLFFLLMACSISTAHEGHQPLPTKGVQVDTDRGYITLSDKLAMR